MTMIKSQDVTKAPGQTAIFITMNLKTPIKKVKEVIMDFCGRIPSIINSIRNRAPEKGFDFVMGFGENAWKKLFKNAPLPSELTTFKEIKGVTRTAVSTPCDLFFHLRSQTMDICFEVSTMIHSLLKEVTTPVDEVHGFRYLDNRAIIGFVDGTENPSAEDASEYALIQDEDHFFNGSSYAFIQKYLHDMDAWNSLSTEEQEKTIGRMKYNDLELNDDDKHVNAHNLVTKVDKNGEEQKIIRANVSFANASKGEFGTFFIGYSKSFITIETMLKQMYLGKDGGKPDRLLDFSIPKTGTLFFIPSFKILDRIANDDWE